MSDSTETERRREVAHRIDQALGDHPNVAAVFVFGSVAYGHTDAKSDVDVGIVCQPDVLDPSSRGCLLSSVNPGWTIDYRTESDPAQAIWDSYDKGTVDGVEVEVHYMTVAKVSRVLEQVVDHGAITTDDVPFRPYRLGSLLQRAWMLRDKQGVFEAWRDWTTGYPPRLKRNILTHNMPVLLDSVDEMKTSAERRLGPGIFLFFLMHGVHAIDSIAFALNEVYDPTSRWAERDVLPVLTNLPNDFLARYNYVLEGPFDAEGALERSHVFEDMANDILHMAEEELDRT